MPRLTKFNYKVAPANVMIWCIHCNEVYPEKDIKKIGDRKLCKNYPKCDGYMINRDLILFDLSNNKDKQEYDLVN